MTEYVPQAWRMTDYYPDSYAKFMAALGVGIDYEDDDFDRYHAEYMADLAEHDRQVAERAWDDGHRDGTGWPKGDNNPYRKEQS